MDLKLTNGSYIYRTNNVDLFLKDVARFPILTPAEEDEYVFQMKEGETEEIRSHAREMLINCNQRFIFAIAKRYASDETLLDLVNVGNIGLIAALDSDKFDRTKGFRFLSFAVWYVRREINYYLVNDKMLVKKSNNVKTNFKATKIKNKYFAENGRFPSYDEIIELFESEYGVKIQDISDVYDVTIDYISTTFNDDDNEFENSAIFTSKTSTDNEFDVESDRVQMTYFTEKMLNILTERERNIIKMAYGFNSLRQEYTNYDIAMELGLTTERVRQLKNSAIEKMRKGAKYIAR